MDGKPRIKAGWLESSYQPNGRQAQCQTHAVCLNKARSIIKPKVIIRRSNVPSLYYIGRRYMEPGGSPWLNLMTSLL